MNSSRSISFGILSGAVAGAAAFFLAQGIVLNNTAQSNPPEVQVENSPVKRESQLTTSFASVVDKVAPSVVSVYTTRTVKEDMSPLFNNPFFRDLLPENGETPDTFREQGLGSGVVISKDGYILTNNHVVENAEEVRVSLENGMDYTAKVIGTDPPTDIAVIKIDAEDLTPITMTDSAKIKVGDIVLAIGNPFGVGQTVTMGIISATQRSGVGIVDYEDFIQTDASINPGNSGGALVDAEGRLIGLNTAILSRTGGNQGIGFAVPSNMARFVVDQITKSGKVVRGYLGVYIQRLTPRLARAFDLPGKKGALVGGVTPDSPAAKAGLSEGDLIVELNGKPILDNTELRLRVAQLPPGTDVDLTVIRRGKDKHFTVKLGELPTEELAQARRGGGGFGQESKSLKGVQLRDLDRATRRRLDMPEQIDGALVAQVDPGSPSYEAGLRRGDVIVEIDQKEVQSADDVRDALRDSKKDSVLLRVWSRGGSHYIVVETGDGTK